MESFIRSYGIPFPDFQVLLQTTNSLVAGSAALSLYLQQNGVEPGFVPSDLDIWIEYTPHLVALHGDRIQHGNESLFTTLMVQNNYYLAAKHEATAPNNDYRELHSITKILSFVKDGKTVQLIFLKEQDLRQYVCENFDLSVCMTWWNAFDNLFETAWPNETLNKLMYHSASGELNEREFQRMEKYLERGFQLLERPCPAVGHRDPRTRVEELRGQTAFDLFAYEEVDCADFLKESSYHVLLRVGEQFQAFHRNTLHDYLKGHLSHHHYLGNLYDTPHKQTICQQSFVHLDWSDYSIVELIPEYTVTIGHATKSLFNCHFYTVEQWLTRAVPGLCCLMPYETEIPAIPVAPVPNIPLYHPDVYWMDG
jgi:hypothetical protein